MKQIAQKTCLVVCIAAAALTGCSTPKNPTRSGSQSMTEVSTNFPPLPEGITSFGAAVDDGWLYVFGGYTGKRHDYCVEKVRGTFYRINLSHDGRNQTWQELPSSEPAQGTAIVAYRNYIYRIGGMAAKNHEGQPQDLVSQNLFERYDIQQKIWTSLASLPEGRSTHDAIVLGGKLYVGGGWDLNGNPFDNDDAAKWHNTLLMADLSQEDPKWQSLPQPFKRRAIAMAAIGSKIYFIGGMDSDNDTSRSVDIYDTNPGIWSKGPDLPHSMMNGFGFAAIGVGDAIYASGFSGDLLRLPVNGTKWESVGKLNEPRLFHRLIPLDDGDLLALGGEGKTGKLRDAEILMR
jgi:N-acetylneuraminic acid mutarotase